MPFSLHAGCTASAAVSTPAATPALMHVAAFVTTFVAMAATFVRVVAAAVVGICGNDTVVDTGLDYDHPDIAGNVFVHPGEDLNGNGRIDPEEWNGIDDDGNGFYNDQIDVTTGPTQGCPRCQQPATGAAAVL